MNIRKPLALLIASITLYITLTVHAQAAGSTRFTDADPSQWYYGALCNAAEAGVLGGHYGHTINPAGTATTAELAEVIFCAQGIWVPWPERGGDWCVPYLDAAASYLGESIEDKILTRLEAAEMIFRILGLPDSKAASPYADMNSPMLSALKEAGIMGGKIIGGTPVFCGGDYLTRAELVAIASKLVEYRQGRAIQQYTCPYYAGLAYTGTLINPNVPYPMEPQTLGDLKQACDYAAIHELDAITFHYSGEQPKGFRDMIYGYLTEISRDYWYERPEYFMYTPRLSFAVKNTKNGYELTIKFSSVDDTAGDMRRCRRDAFAAAVAVHKGLYASGTLAERMNETERAKAMLTWVLDHASYKDSGDSLSHTAWSIFERGTGVCDAYSSALQLLLSIDGIQCWGQKGSSKLDGVMHHWTVVVLDGEKLNIDATWCEDAGYGYRYEYFAVPDDMLALTHAW